MHAQSLAAMACVAVLGMSATAVAAGDAASALQERFGQKLDRVADTPERDDDLKLARQMLETAEAKGEENPTLGRLLCERAARLVEGHTEGAEVRIRALRKLARLDPKQRSETLSTAASIAQRRYRLADGGQQEQHGETLIGLLMDLAAAHEDDNEREAARLFYDQALEIAEEIDSERVPDVKAAMHQLEIADRIDKLEARLESDPTDHEAADKLMRLYVVERDAPEKADEYYFSADDEALKEHVSTATRSPQFLSAEEYLALGRSYQELMGSASKWAKPKMRRRAETYYQKFLEAHGRKDETYQEVKAALESLDEAASSQPKLADASSGSGSASAGTSDSKPAGSKPAGSKPNTADASSGGSDSPASMERDKGEEGDATTLPAAPEGEGWIALLGEVDPARLSRQGAWEKADNGELLGTPPAPSQLILPTVPSGDYELRVQFTRTSPIGLPVLHLTVDGKAVLVRLGDRRRRKRDYVAGLSMVDGEPATSNATTTQLELETDRRYTVRARVETEDGPGVTIKVWLDGEPLLTWEGYSASLDVAEAWKRIPDEALGLGVDDAGTIRFHAVHLKMLSGEHKPFGD